MEKKDHLERHKYLHKALDELSADMIEHAEMIPSKTTVFELMRWSAKQCNGSTIHIIKEH